MNLTYIVPSDANQTFKNISLGESAGATVVVVVVGTCERSTGVEVLAGTLVE